MSDSASSTKPSFNGGQSLDLSHLLHPVRVREAVVEWLKEDTPSFDYGGFVVGDKQESAFLVCKGEGVLAGVPFLESVFHELDCSVHWSTGVKEGECVHPLTILASIKGKARNILLGERVALNCLSRFV